MIIAYDREFKRLDKANNYLKDKKKITDSMGIELHFDYVSKRMLLLSDYRSKRFLDNSDKISKEANWDEVTKKYVENEQEINELEKSPN